MTDTAPSIRLKRLLRLLWPVAFWLAIWHVASVAIGHDILLVSPIDAFARLGELAGEADFWASIAQSLSRIALGFLSATISGVLFAIAASRMTAIRDLLAPLVAAVKAVPVASFVILVLIWVSSEHLSVIISFLMVFPIVYTNMLEGIEQTDRRLLEMAEVFGVGAFDRVRFIYCSQALPYFQAACSLSLGMCWKAGIAAEVIGLPAMSIGEHLYEAKVYLDTADLFAWTIVIILSLIHICIGQARLAKVVGLQRQRVDDIDRNAGVGDRELRHGGEALGRKPEQHVGIHVERARERVFQRVGRLFRVLLSPLHAAFDPIDELHDKAHQVVLLQHQEGFTPTWSNARSVA